MTERIITLKDAPERPTETEAMRLVEEAGRQLGEQWAVVKPGLWIFLRDGRNVHMSRRRFYAALADATQATVRR